jgi:hypothetical protein
MDVKTSLLPPQPPTPPLLSCSSCAHPLCSAAAVAANLVRPYCSLRTERACNHHLTLQRRPATYSWPPWGFTYPRGTCQQEVAVRSKHRLVIQWVYSPTPTPRAEETCGLDAKDSHASGYVAPSFAVVGREGGLGKVNRNLEEIPHAAMRQPSGCS